MRRALVWLRGTGGDGTSDDRIGPGTAGRPDRDYSPARKGGSHRNESSGVVPVATGAVGDGGRSVCSVWRPGLFSCYLRQALRLGNLLPAGLDATIDVTNLLAQGYRPFLSTDGKTLFLAEAPRTLQAGLAFTF